MDDEQRSFDVVVLTFPDARAAKVASEGPLWRDLQARYTDVVFLATTDPFGCRVGSGGGTLAALGEVVDWQTSSEQQGQKDTDLSSNLNILILHAGGQSSRCPSQMTFGKAWTTLPTTQGLLTPIHIWLEFMFRHFAKLPTGSIAVIAADTMLRIPLRSDSMRQSLWQSFDREAVVVLTVPAPLETAQNHGVFVLQDDEGYKTPDKPVACHQILQKPSLQSLTDITHGQPTAWIDTGVLLFQSAAADALRTLIHSPALYGCTRRGLEHLYHEAEASTDDDIATFCAQRAVSVDLYTHMLQAVGVSGETLDRQAYGEKFRSLSDDVADALYKVLSSLKVELWIEPEGKFLHLGTTVELMDFYNSAMSSPHGQPDDNLTVMQRFATDIDLQSRHHVVLASSTLQTPHDCSVDSVIYHCLLRAPQHLSVGPCSLIEFCNVDCPRIEIGSNCWVSGLRGKSDAILTIPDGLLVQELSLSQETRVYMVVGCSDPIKKASMLYGKPWDDVTSQAGWTSDDIWGDLDSSYHTLWHARIHPVFRAEEGFAFSKLFSWLSLLDSDGAMHEDSLKDWRKHPRLSLSEIREQADAALEFAFRDDLISSKIPAGRKILLEELISQFNMFNVVNLTQLQMFWKMLYGSFCAWILNGKFECVGAAAMRFATALKAVPKHVDDKNTSRAPPEELQVDIESLQILYGWELSKKMEKLLASVDDFITNDAVDIVDCIPLSGAFASLSAACTKICVGVSTSTAQKNLKSSTIFDKWVVATAPARIDFAGGWSDTPPICFEYGSVVTGIAVSVDGYAPLACRCRIIRGGSGVSLRAESRSPKDWTLNSSVDVKIKTLEDLEDFHNPSSPCALLKCALICLGLANSSQLASPSINVDALARDFFGSDKDIGVEIISTSLLPQGSGMGTSSILAGCILAAIAHCRGVSLSTESLIHCVLELEQRLTTGGGFQDQANGLVGGVKITSCEAGVVQPVHVHWQKISLSGHMQHHLDNCLHLIYTGKTRLAKNLLLQCLERWSTRTDEICDTVSKLALNANTAAQAFEAGDLDEIGRALDEYWTQKKVMAGPSSGVEPTVVATVLQSLKKGDLIRAGSLCGAGGGGFMVLLGKDGVTAEMMKAQLVNDGVETEDLVWHKARLDHDGLALKCVNEDELNVSIMWRGESAGGPV